jgi:alanine racemase
MALRKAGVQCPIMVLNADPQRFQDLLEWRLEPEVHRPSTLDQWARARANHTTTGPNSHGVHLKVETGMHRLGLSQEEAQLAGKKCAELGIPILSVYSHLSAADDPKADSHTRGQIRAYDSACAAVSDGWTSVKNSVEASHFMRHLANTAGASRFPEARFDMVRIGLGLYGLDASDTMKNLQPIGRFHTRISHLHTVPAGAPVGYGASDTADHLRRIATLPVGYADGLPRAAGMGRAHLYAGGQLCPTAGPVCMDGCMIDVTGLKVNVGDSVEIFGDHAAIEDLASATDTIPYEILCRIPQRVRRRHLRT